MLCHYCLLEAPVPSLWQHSTGGNKMRPAVMVLIFIALAGCSSGKAQDLAACRAEADRFYQGYRDDDAANPRGRYIVECMASKGYEFNVSPADCDSGRALLAQQACYVSTSWIGRLLDRF
jgi:hypothetical protein